MPLTVLPDELMSHILSQLPPRALAAAVRACRKWSEVLVHDAVAQRMRRLPPGRQIVDRSLTAARCLLFAEEPAEAWRGFNRRAVHLSSLTRAHGCQEKGHGARGLQLSFGTHLALHSNGETLVCASTVLAHVIPLTAGRSVKRLPALNRLYKKGDRRVTAVACDGDIVATSFGLTSICADGIGVIPVEGQEVECPIMIWRLSDDTVDRGCCGEHIAVLKHPSYRVSTLAMRGDMLVSGCEGDARDHPIRVWSLSQRHVTATLAEHTGRINGLGLGNTRLVSASADGSARVWSLEGERTCMPAMGHPDAVHAVAVEGDRVATACVDVIFVWSISSACPQCLSLIKFGGIVTSVFLCGGALVGGGDTGMVKVWDGTMADVATMDAGTAVLGVALSSSRMRIACLGLNSLTIWRPCLEPMMCGECSNGP